MLYFLPPSLYLRLWVREIYFWLLFPYVCNSSDSVLTQTGSLLSNGACVFNGEQRALPGCTASYSVPLITPLSLLLILLSLALSLSLSCFFSTLSIKSFHYIYFVSMISTILSIWYFNYLFYHSFYCSLSLSLFLLYLYLHTLTLSLPPSLFHSPCISMRVGW